jgi:hypothetical protein
VAATILPDAPNAALGRRSIAIRRLEFDSTARETRIHVRWLPDERARDALDEGSYFSIITEDRALTDYAAAQQGTATRAMPWMRTYLRLGERSSLGTSLDAVDVDADARIAQLPDSCAIGAETHASRAARDLIVYASGDRTAKALAERLVAIEGGRAVEVPRSELHARLREGGDRAYVLAVPVHEGWWCDTMRGLSVAAPWLGTEHITPLIDTRPHAITRADP